tara:strand:+ start:5808 stop:6212 length:405 start_codon:yes stop_codon:yes gene_type:complete
MSTNNNLTFSLYENESKHEEEDVDYNEILKDIEEEESKRELSNKNVIHDEVSLDDMAARELDYDTNYTKKDLVKIAEYYEISIRKKNKSVIISDIVIFESAIENTAIVERRRELWFYINEINEDKYLSKYLIFD